MLGAGDDLPLVHQVRVAAQGRSAPRVLIHAQALVRRRMGDHAHLHLCRPAIAAAAALAAVDARHAMVVQHLAPGTVGKDHQFGDDLIQRRATLAARHGDDVIFHIKVEIDAVILFRLQAKRFALLHAPLFQLLRPLPQHGEVGLVRVLSLAAGQGFLVDHVVELVVAQVAGDRHQLGARLRADHGPVRFGVQGGVQRQGRAGRAFRQGKRIDDFVRQHGDLVARHVNGGHALARHLVDHIFRADTQPWRGDVNTHFHSAVRQRLHGEGIVDLGGGHVVDREGGHVGQRQLGRDGRHGHVGETGAFREILEEEFRQMQIFRRSNTADGQHQACRGRVQFRARRVQRLVFNRVLVRLEQQLQHHGLHRGGQTVLFQLFHIACLHQRLLLFLLDAGQGRLQRRFRRRLVAASALLVEIHGRRMQGQDQAGRFRRQRCVAEILGAQLGKAELVFARHFPQEIKVDLGGDALGLFQQLGRGRLFILQQYILGLDLGAFAAGHLDLVSFTRLRQDRADLEIAGFFKK